MRGASSGFFFLTNPRLLDDLCDSFRLVNDHLQVFPGTFFIIEPFLSQVRPPADDVEGCADFMGEPGGKLGRLSRASRSDGDSFQAPALLPPPGKFSPVPLSGKSPFD